MPQRAAEEPARVASRLYDAESRCLALRLHAPVLDDGVINALSSVLAGVTERPARYLLDFGRIEHVRSSGPSLIVPFWCHGGHGVNVSIVHCSESVRAQLQASGFQHLFSII